MRFLNSQYHLSDRKYFALSASGVAWLEPVEATHRIISPLLLGIENGEALLLRQLRPARRPVISGGRLRASVQHDDQRASGRQLVGREEEGPKIAGIGSEVPKSIQGSPSSLAGFGFARCSGGQPRDGICDAAHSSFSGARREPRGTSYNRVYAATHNDRIRRRWFNHKQKKPGDGLTGVAGVRRPF